MAEIEPASPAPAMPVIVTLPAEIDLTGAHEPISIEAVLAAPNGGSARVIPGLLHYSV